MNASSDILRLLIDEYKQGFPRGTGGRKLGPEIEGILFDREHPEAVPGLDKVSGLFENIAIRERGARAVREPLMIGGSVTFDHITGLKMTLGDYEIDITTDMSRCTLEVTVPPSSSLKKNMQDIKRIMEIVSRGADGLRMDVLGLGTHPFAPRSLSNMMPKQRYALMSRRFTEDELVGMTITAAAQFHCDVERQNAVELINVLNGFTPALIAATANSTVVEGRITPCKEYRGTVWDMHASRGSIEGSRIGIPAIFRDLDHYLEYLVGHSPIISKREFEGSGETRVLFEDKHATFAEVVRKGSAEVYRMDTGQTEKIVPGFLDLQALESTVWPDTRLRRAFGTDEFRPCSFQPSSEEIMAIGAVVHGLAGNINEAKSFLSQYSIVNIKNARRDAIVGGFEAAIGETPLAKVAGSMLEIAGRGLEDECRGLLLPILRNVEERTSPADMTREFLADTGMGSGKIDRTSMMKFAERHRFRV